MSAEEALVPIGEAGGAVEGRAEPAQEGGGGGRRVRVILLREGLAKSGRYFTLAALHDVARAAEGLRCFADHPTPDEDRQRPSRSVRDLVGYFRNPRVVFVRDLASPSGRAQVEATLHVLESAGWLWDLIEASLALGQGERSIGRRAERTADEARRSARRREDDGPQTETEDDGRRTEEEGQAGAPERPELIGLSIDALCRVRRGAMPAPEGSAGPQTVQIVESVVVLKSCDVVTRASAGGRFVAILGRRLDHPAERTTGRGGVRSVEGEGERRLGHPAERRARRAEDEGSAPGPRERRTKEDERLPVGRSQEEQETMVETQIQRAPGRSPGSAESTGPFSRSPGSAESTGPSDGARAAEALALVREDGGDLHSDRSAPAAPSVASSQLSVARSQLPESQPLTTDHRPLAAEVSEALAQVREAQLRLECAHLLSERLAELPLPEPVRAKLRRAWDPFGPAQQAGSRWATSEAYARALEAAIDAEVETLAALRDALGSQGAGSRSQHTDFRLPATDHRPGEPGGASLVHGYGATRIDAGIDAVTRGRAAVQVALDRLFGLQESEDDPDVALLRRAGIAAPRWMGLREAYTQITGDALVTGTVQPELSIVREANEVTTAVLNMALLNSMTKRLVADYAGQPQDWRRFCTITAIRDFKQQDRIRLFDFGSLSTVAEGAAYTNLAWDDAKESYTPQKRGNTVVVTREAILNDDLGAIRRIPTKLAVAAGVTMNEFVYGLFTSNPFMSNGDKVFDDGVQTSHGNRITAALDAAGLRTGLLTMLKQTNSAGKRLGIRPRFLLVPPDLLFTALTLVQSALVPGSNNNDRNVLQGAVEVISVPQFVDTTDWYLVTDPQQVETIELGFVGGRETPELLLQDRPDTGQVFTNDQITYKIRWEFGGGWVDYRGALWSQVAGA